jgi:hypothetical protein
VKVSKASNIWLDYHRSNSKKNTHRCNSVAMNKFCEATADMQLGELTVNTILDFLNQMLRDR